MHLIYVSSATEPLSDADIDQILDTSRANNREVRVTGLLLFKDDCFLQVLEGEDDAIVDTFDRIKSDRRHRAIDILRYEHIPRRSFGRWHMAFANHDTLAREATDTFEAFIDEHFDEAHLELAGSKVYDLVLAFKNDLWKRL
jgi:hypothetical protein